jgi:hypothetical protein
MCRRVPIVTHAGPVDQVLNFFISFLLAASVAQAPESRISNFPGSAATGGYLLELNGYEEADLANDRDHRLAGAAIGKRGIDTVHNEPDC